ncbi:helix-turn-helix domain-containing protein [Streptomyces sp. ASQP_92]|uniref:PucR family transcriptional regulator n=1 Tax=Streptomyces sp. ASQP_92 TaxID=2979116 RepID=UPI0021BE2DFF|nr:helix-turn-helix domain-containing protein [Streptomyces sp. ASQP_92]MCT9092565.1 helix-turn-helix domain-containing protein [Streptomyces sp. ASQP_92]
MEDGTTGLSPAAAALAARCEPRVNELARRLARGVFEQLRGYAELPGDVKDVEIAATARHALRLFLRGAAEGAGPESLEYFQERAAQRAEERMPLHLLLRTYTLGVRELWGALREEAGPGEHEALAELAGELFSAADRVVGAVAESYLDEQAALVAEHQEQRRSRARALLEGRPVTGGVALDGPVLVVCLRFGDSPASGGNCRSPVAVRRLVRRVQAALDRAFSTEVLAVLDDTGGYAVIPGASELPIYTRELVCEAAGVQARMAPAAAVGAADIPRAARLTADVVRISAARGARPGVHRLDDVLLEYHLSRPSEGSARIAALLDPLAARPELIETLRTHLEQRQNRRATARVLNLHPNSVDNRLARAQELTGLDLAEPKDVALTLAALLLREAGSGITE